jgi:hypothetical protein
MTRSVSTAIVLTLGLAVSAAVFGTVFAQRNQNASPASPVVSAPAESSPQVRQKPAGEQEKERDSIRAGSLSISATPQTNPATVKENKIPEIEVDSSNVRTVPKDSVQPIRESKRELAVTSDLPAGSLAEKITDTEAKTVSVWRPAFASQGFRGARLDAFAVSQDGTVLAIAERTGTFNGPNGTRIILFNTSNWQAIRVFTTERMLKKIAFIPGGTTMAAVAFPQLSRKQEFGLAAFDLATGEEQAFLQLPFPFNEAPYPEDIALAVTPEYAFCSGFFKTTVFCIPLPIDTNAAVPYHTFETVAPASALAVTPDGKSLAAASLSAIEYFDINPAAKFRRKSITTLDLGWNPVDLHFLNGAQTEFILCPAYRHDSPPIFIRSASKDSLDGRSAGFAVPMEQGTQIGVAFKVKGRIDVVDPATLEAVDSVILEQLRPATNGDTAFVFYLDSIHAFCVVDTNGNCFAAGRRPGEKRWSKRIIWNGGAAKK